MKYSCFTMVCYFLLYSKVDQLYIYIYLLFLDFPSHLDHHRASSRFLVWYSRFSLVIYLTHSSNSVSMSILISQLIPSALCHLGIHRFVLYICVSIYALQIRSPIPTFSDSTEWRKSEREKQILSIGFWVTRSWTRVW